jgi:hypothetical protein
MGTYRTPRRMPVTRPRVDAEDEGWPPEQFEKLFEEMLHLSEYSKSSYASIDLHLTIQQRSYALLNVYYLGLGSRQREAMVKRLAPQWLELTALMASNQAKAKAQARRAEATQ